MSGIGGLATTVTRPSPPYSAAACFSARRTLTASAASPSKRLSTVLPGNGFMNIPEFSASRRLDAGRIDPDKMIEGVNAALSTKFGEGKYVTAWWNPNLYVDYRGSGCRTF
jgi:hypothetical protein